MDTCATERNRIRGEEKLVPYIYIYPYLYILISQEKISSDTNGRYETIRFGLFSRFVLFPNKFSLPLRKKDTHILDQRHSVRRDITREEGGKERDVTSSRARVRQEGRGRGRSEAFGAVSSLATVASSNGGGCTSLQLGELDERYVYSSNGTRVVAGRVAGAQSRRSRRSANFPSVANKRHLRGFGYYESSSFLPSPRSRALPQGRTKSLRPPTEQTIWQLTTGLEAND